MMFVFIRGKAWERITKRCTELETEGKRDRDDALRAIAARQRAELALLQSLEREREAMAQLVDCTKLVGKLRLRHGATEAEVEAERKRKEAEEDVSDVDHARASTEFHDQEVLDARRSKDGVDHGFQEL